MSEPASARADTVVPDPQASSTEPGSGSPSTVPESGLESTQRMAERLRFYESFDELIQQNIARSGQLLREAADRRDEALAAIAQSRQQIANERETQRAALTELLDDVMTIQQATERLAHRVSDALEQIEFELEPVGLHGASSLSGGAPGRLPGLAGNGFTPSQTVAEDVHDEFNRGVLGQRTPGGEATQSGSMTSGPAGSQDLAAAGSTAGGPSWASPATATHLAETDAPAGSGPRARDIGSSSADRQGMDRQGDEGHEPATSDVTDGVPVGQSAESSTLPQPARSANAGGFDSASRVAEPTAAPPESSPADASRASTDGGVNAEGVSSELSGLAPHETGVQTPTGTAPAETTGTTAASPSVEVPNLGAAPPIAVDVTDDEPAGTGRSTVPASSGDDLGADTSARSDSVSVATVAPSERVTSPVIGTEPRPTSQPQPAGMDAPQREQQTTVVLDGVPRAAVALALQRHILSKPDVLRAEVREYYDHRLTLFVTGRRPTTADDLSDWDGSASWEQIRSSPELLELRMVM